MPYIKKEQRKAIEEVLIPLGASQLLDKPGELNFAITTLVLSYLGLVPEHDGWETEAEPSYAGLNEVIGVLECVQLELYRRAAAPYEDKKCTENGDVYLSEETRWSNELCSKCSGYAGGSDGVCLPCALEEAQHV